MNSDRGIYVEQREDLLANSPRFALHLPWFLDISKRILGNTC